MRDVNAVSPKDLLDQNLRQILIEVHGVKKLTEPFFKDLHKEGYAIFHKEPNLYTKGSSIELPVSIGSVSELGGGLGGLMECR